MKFSKSAGGEGEEKKEEKGGRKERRKEKGKTEEENKKGDERKRERCILRATTPLEQSKNIKDTVRGWGGGREIREKTAAEVSEKAVENIMTEARLR